MTNLSDFVEINPDLDINEIMSITHTCIIEYAAKSLCDILKNDEIKSELQEKIRILKKDRALSIFIKKYLVIKLPETDLIIVKDIVYHNTFKLKSRDENIQKYKEKLYKLQNGMCLACMKKYTIDKMHVDHIIPHSMVGDNVEKNLQLLCANCNESKNDDPFFPLKILVKTGKIPSYAIKNYVNQ